VPIPKGSFQIGMNGGIRDSSPSSPVDVEAFLMMKYPVTNYQYWLFTQATGWPPPPHWGGQEPPKKIWTHPVVAVSWGEAIFFCSWLWLVTPWKWRLPTEAEWEYAARGTDGRHFPWGNTFDKSRANTLEGGKNKISDVNAFGSRNESPFGVRDMVGNVWEWTSSLFESYPYTPKTTIEIPTIPSAIFTMSWWDPNETKITMRGGSWGLDKSYSTTYARIWSSAGNRGMYGGFRLVVTGSRRPVVGGFFNNFELNPYADTAAAAMFGAEGWWSKSIEYAGSCGGGVIPAPHPAQKRWKIF
jgi:formylglycine-generating enzyme required for sulfatase activity